MNIVTVGLFWINQNPNSKFNKILYEKKNLHITYLYLSSNLGKKETENDRKNEDGEKKKCILFMILILIKMKVMNEIYVNTNYLIVRKNILKQDI